MKPVSCCMALVVMLSLSCHTAPGSMANTGKQAGVSPADAAKFTGIYSGSFDKGIITLTINYISGKNVSGYNVHKGLRRNMNGTVTAEGAQLQFVLNEPGDNPSDGVFNFSLDTASLKIKGKWIPPGNSGLKAKNLALSRRDEQPLEEHEWTTSGEGDTTLVFHGDGSCEYAFYERPQDSISQLITIRGNYERKADTFKVEWQKNTHTPAQAMKLIKIHVKKKWDSGEDYETVYLRGHGWEFFILEGG